MEEFLEKPVTLARLAAVLTQRRGPKPPSHGTAFESVRRASSSAGIPRVICAEIPEIRRQLAAASAAGDTSALRWHAHYLHTSALLLDDPALAALCSQLGQEAAAGDLPAVTATHANLDACLARITA